MRILIILFVILLFENASCQSQVFEKGEYNGLKYRLLIPDTSKSRPLIVFLHGAGERGDDNQRQLTYIDTIFGSSWFQQQYPSFILAPQCPDHQRWVEVDWSDTSIRQPSQPSVPLLKTLRLIDRLKDQYPIDTSRIYILGLSMGGFGVWDALYRRPELFAAAVPICGGADTSIACVIADIPVWVFHGSKDNVVPVVLSRNMIKALRRCGGKPIYTEYPDVKHGAWFKALADRRLYKWLFNQRKVTE